MRPRMSQVGRFKHIISHATHYFPTLHIVFPRWPINVFPMLHIVFPRYTLFIHASHHFPTLHIVSHAIHCFARYTYFLILNIVFFPRYTLFSHATHCFPTINFCPMLNIISIHHCRRLVDLKIVFPHFTHYFPTLHNVFPRFTLFFHATHCYPTLTNVLPMLNIISIH